jgi:hypothetical protein
MKLRAVAFAVLGIMFSQHNAAFADEDVGKKFIKEYRRAYPADKWELLGSTPRMANNVRVYYKRTSENVLRTNVCTKLRKKSEWMCEAAPNLPEGSVQVK